MYLSKRKEDFLRSVGFEKSYSSEPRHQLGATVRMETWKRYYSDTDELTIFFDSVDGNRCDLYRGSGSTTAEQFSERNLVSELQKRGYGGF